MKISEQKRFFPLIIHELTVLDEKLTKLSNVHVSAIEQQGKLVFLHKVKKGAADKSYGIHVAELAELPASLIKRANEVLNELEKSARDSQLETAVTIDEEEESTHVQEQLTFFEPPESNKVEKSAHKVLEKIRSIDILELNPMQAQ